MSTAVALRNQELMLAGPVGSLDAYIQAVGSVPVLSKEDEQALAIRFHEHNDLLARSELLGDHAHLAHGREHFGADVLCVVDRRHG